MKIKKSFKQNFMEVLEKMAIGESNEWDIQKLKPNTSRDSGVGAMRSIIRMYELESGRFFSTSTRNVDGYTLIKVTRITAENNPFA